jgi:copper chaperone CopZ
MTCGGCAATVQRLLFGVVGVIGVQIDLPHHAAWLGMKSDIDLSTLQAALSVTHYRISEPEVQPA